MPTQRRRRRPLLACLIALATSVEAVALPLEGHETFNVHSNLEKRTLADRGEVHSYQSRSIFETFGTEGYAHPLSKRADLPFTHLATAFLAERTGLNDTDFKLRATATTDVSKLLWYDQQLNGIKVANGNANMAVNDVNNIAAFGSNFMSKPIRVASAKPKLTVADAIAIAEEVFDGKFNGHSSMEYFINDNNEAILTYAIQIKNFDGYLEAYISAEDGDVVHQMSFTSHASFRALPIYAKDPYEPFELIVNPEIPAASPNGWVGGMETQGNNVLAYHELNASATIFTRQTSPGVFDIARDPSADPRSDRNIAAAVVNAFYVANAIHDITYLYGFTESMFNYQLDNRGLGGLAGDRVKISVQDSSDRNNAQFTTFPDGQSGLMEMFFYERFTPIRDSAFANDVVAHEFTHGLSGRLTGGGSARCISSFEARGLSEGWSDTFANWLNQLSAPIQDYGLGQWVGFQTPDGVGIRDYKYSTNKAVNPLMYTAISAAGKDEHRIGTVWATMLHQVLAMLVEAKGFSVDAKTNPSGSAGNVVFMRLFIDSMVLQPCQPTFLTARDAWIQADANRYRGEHRCILWNAFAFRGLGVEASSSPVLQNSNHIPPDCPIIL